IDGEDRLPDARRAAFLDEEAVGLESVRGARERAHEELHGEREHGALHAAFASVVGRPSLSIAHPSGMGLPSRAASMILPRATAESERSIMSGGAERR